MFAATLLVLLIIVVELYRPIIIGDAIDKYINGYYQPYMVCREDTPGSVAYKDIYLTRELEEAAALMGDCGVGLETDTFYQIFLYEDQYYMAERLEYAETEILAEASAEELAPYTETAVLLAKEDLKELRHYDFSGVLGAAGIYLLVLAAGFVLNAANTWILQKMGQKIIYTMREQVFTHIHSLSLNFFNTTPVGKLVTRVSNDTESVNELFTSILIKLFKNIVKIIGYAVVMISYSLQMALVSFLLLPVVGVLTFVFRALSRKAYQITRNKITELNTFLSEHLSGMRLIQIFAREEEKYKEFTDKSMELFKANWREVMTFAIFRPSIYMVSVIAMILVIGTGSASVLAETLSLGTLFIFITYPYLKL